ncbi:MAG: hypothetical protein KC535_01865 [Nanoarchaeota archaeon]|nr:hypothetical protein [Nanoarchaeota archaeon]
MSHLTSDHVEEKLMSLAIPVHERSADDARKLVKHFANEMEELSSFLSKKRQHLRSIQEAALMTQKKIEQELELEIQDITGIDNHILRLAKDLEHMAGHENDLNLKQGDIDASLHQAKEFVGNKLRTLKSIELREVDDIRADVKALEGLLKVIRKG